MVKPWHTNLLIVSVLAFLAYVLIRSDDTRYLMGLVVVVVTYNLITVVLSNSIGFLGGLYPFLALNAALLPLLAILFLPDIGSVEQLLNTMVDLRSLLIPIAVSYIVVALLGERSLLNLVRS